jgi:hypothetical protein
VKTGQIIPFGEWLPDHPVLNNPGATVATNVYPRSDKTYGPLPSISAIGSALATNVIGAISARDNAGNAYSFAGIRSKLYRIDGQVLTDVSVGGGSYNTVVGEYWRFAQFGDYIVATNFADAPQKFAISSDSAFSVLSADAPKARHVAKIRSHLVLANTNDTSDGARPSRVWWSEIGDPTSWPTPATSAAAAAQSGFSNDLTGGWIQGLTGAVGGADGVVFCEDSIHRMTYIGSPDVFQFDEIERGRGTKSPGSIINIGPLVAYYGTDGFYMFNGAQSIPIGNGKVDQTFADALTSGIFTGISAAYDPEKRIIIWSYLNSSGTYQWIIWNWMTGWWAEAEVETEWIWSALTAPLSLDNMSQFFGNNLDNFQTSLDSRAWTGGSPYVGGFDSDHQLVSFTGGLTLEAVLETAEFSSPRGSRVFINGFRPVVEVADFGSYDAEDAVTCKVKHRDHIGETASETTATNPHPSTFVAPCRVNTRYARAQVTIASTVDSTGVSWTRALGVEPQIREIGSR